MHRAFFVGFDGELNIFSEDLGASLDLLQLIDLL